MDLLIVCGKLIVVARLTTASTTRPHIAPRFWRRRRGNVRRRRMSACANRAKVYYRPRHQVETSLRECVPNKRQSLRCPCLAAESAERTRGQAAVSPRERRASKVRRHSRPMKSRVQKRRRFGYPLRVQFPLPMCEPVESFSLVLLDQACEWFPPARLPRG